MTVLPGFPDIEQVICQALEDEFDGLSADTTTPPDFTGKLPFARVVCHGGGDDGITDTSRLTIDYFHATRADAQPGVEAVRQFLTQRGGFTVNGTVIDIGRTDTKPQDIPWNDANNPRRFVYSCALDARR